MKKKRNPLLILLLVLAVLLVVYAAGCFLRFCILIQHILTLLIFHKIHDL